MIKEDYSSEELIKLAEGWVEGDKESFSKLYDRFVDNLYKFIFFKVKSGEAEDLTELVFIKAWENRKKYHPSKSSFSSWLYTIARNTVIDHYRVSKSVSELDVRFKDESNESNPHFLAEQSFTAEKLKEAIDKLSPAYRDILLLRFIEDFEYEEIARVLDKTEGAIRIMQFRALKELKVILEKMGFNQ